MFRAIQPYPKKKITFTRVFAFLTGICAVVLLFLYAIALIPNLFRYKDVILEFSFKVVIATIATFLLTAISYILSKGKKRNFSGNLELLPAEIILNNNSYTVSDLEKIRFIGNDIQGDFRGFKSFGTENELIMTLKNGQEIRTFFEQTNENKLQNQIEVLKSYRDQKILSEANFQNILNNTNYY